MSCINMRSSLPPAPLSGAAYMLRPGVGGFMAGVIDAAMRREAEDHAFDIEARARGYAPELTCRMYRDEEGTWHCKSCEDGSDKITGSDGTLDNWCDSWHPNFCPNCGARVVE